MTPRPVVHTRPSVPVSWRMGMHGPSLLPVWPDSPAGRRLRDAREAAGLSLRAAASMLGLSAVSLGELERGAALPVKPDGWERMHAALAVEPACTGRDCP